MGSYFTLSDVEIPEYSGNVASKLGDEVELPEELS